MDKTTIAEHELGEKAKEFLGTELGKYINGCSLQDIDEAKDRLLEINPYDYKTLEELQNAIVSIQKGAKVAEGVRLYIAEAIQRGEQALHKLSEEESDNG